jgi:hypothetical protein
MSLDYFHIPINNKVNNIEEFINIHKRINEIQTTLSRNILINYDYKNDFNNDSNNGFNNDSNNDFNNYCDNDYVYKNNKIQIKNANFYIKINKNSELYNKYNCPICYEYIFKNNLKILSCKHLFCTKCFKNWTNTCIEKSLIITCPLCRENILNI